MARRPAAVPASAAPPAAAPSWLRPAVLLLAVAAFLTFTTAEVGDFDFWWHLKTGQFMVEQHRLPVPDEFAFTTYLGGAAYPGEEIVRYFNLTHEWLAQVFFYLLYAATGFGGIVLLRAVLLTGFCGLVGLTVYHRTASFYRGRGAAAAAATVAWRFGPERPYLISFLLLALTLVIVDSRRRWWLLPPLFLVWANCHSGFILGFAVLGAYCGEALYLRFRGKPPADERKLWLVTAACLGLAALNPNGYRVLQVMRLYQSSPMQASIDEWQYPLPWPPTPFSVLLAGALVVMIWQRRRTRPADWLLLLVFGAASLTAVRNIILAGFVGPLLIGSYLPWKPRVAVVAEYALASLLLVIAAVQVAQHKAFQLHAAQWKYCGGAADFLLAHHITGRLFNTWEMGGYLIWKMWPQERVFIDGRALNEKVHRDYQRIAFNAEAVNGKSGEALLNEYGIEVILMNGFQYENGVVYLLPAALADPKQTEWKLVYHDTQAMVYMRHPPPDVQVLNSLEALGALETQCTTFISHDPGRPKCALGLAGLFARIGDPVRAHEWRLTYARYTE
jgi:hypothetical protein